MSNHEVEPQLEGVAERRRRFYQPTDQPTLLVGEPDPRQLEVVVASCSDTFLDVVGCADTNEALFMTGRLRPEIVLLGAALPGAPLPDVISTIRAIDDVPIVVGVDDGEIDLAGPALMAGATELTGRPYRTTVLLSLVKRLIPDLEARKLEAGHLEVGTLSLDGPGYAVRVDGRPLSLTLREFELLRMLMNHADRVVTYEEIRDRVWGVHGEDVAPSTVKVHVHRLRTQIGDAAELVSVRGVGYRLSA